jgi:hypothetical protein
MDMATTVTIDTEIAAQVYAAAEKLRQPVEQIYNEALRRGLEQMRSEANTPNLTTPRRMGLREGVSIDHIQDVLATIEGDAAR